MQVRLISYNVHKCIGGVDRRYEPERVVDTLAHHRPDVVMLQECANGSGRRDWDRQVDLLGDGLGFRHRTWFPNHRFRRGGEYGNGILSRWPIESTENIDLTVAGRKARSVLHAHLRVRTGAGHTRTLHVFNMHLGLREDTRRRQLDRFVECHPFARLHRDTPVVVGGDLNDVWGTLGPRHFEAAGFAAMPRRIRTFPAWGPFQALDGLYVRGDLRMTRIEASRLALARKASDHLPLIAQLELTTD